MALLTALLTPLAFAAAQQTGDPPFTCALPQGYSAFAPVSGRSEAWESKTEAGDARFLVERFLLDGYGAHADSVLRDLKQRAWGTTALEAEEISFTAWSGQWGGVPEIAGHTVNYKKEGKQPGAVVERVAVVGEQMIHFLWDGPATRIAEGLDTADRFRIPDVWIPAPAVDRDLHRGLAPGSEALALPWALEIRLDFVSRRDQGDLDVAVRAKPVAEGGRIPARAEWNLPPGAIDLGTDEDGFIRYRLSASADPNQPLFAWSLLYSPQGDLAAFDPIWLALPAEPPGRWLPPSWSLEARHPGHVELLGPTEWMHKHELEEQGALTQVGPVPAGLCWPFFVSGRFQKRQQSGTTWYLRLDAKAIVPDEAVAALHRLVKAADAWLGVPGDGAWTVVSFPRAGDRVLPGLFVLDEEQEWFAK
ncbi:MAG: hypothetical protein O3A20_08250, partial [Planctomycetota bacterium]|nr:hypothetical protein [Planctomycetota bacterium]